MKDVDIKLEKENIENCPHCGSADFYLADESFTKEHINLFYTCDKCKEGFMRVYKFAWIEY